jgi:hypothetical protein
MDDNGTKKRVKPLLWNKVALEEFDTAERVAKAVKHPDYASALVVREVTAAQADALLALLATARGFSDDAVQTSTESMGSTRTESAERSALMVAIREVQAAARQKHAATHPEKLRDYGIGVPLGSMGFVRLTGIAEAIYEKTGDETLPGITEAKRDTLHAALDAYKTADTTQGAKRSGASVLRTQRDQTLKEIKAARRTVQFAADAQWPYTTPENQAAREAFQLPTNKPFTG